MNFALKSFKNFNKIFAKLYRRVLLKAGNTFEHTVCRGALNLARRTMVCLALSKNS